MSQRTYYLSKGKQFVLSDMCQSVVRHCEFRNTIFLCCISFKNAVCQTFHITKILSKCMLVISQTTTFHLTMKTCVRMHTLLNAPECGYRDLQRQHKKITLLIVTTTKALFIL